MDMIGEDEDAESLQQEELDVLQSIYEGDDAFQVLAPDHLQYKFGDDAAAKSFVLDLRWGSSYPDDAPTVSLDAFYNRNLLQPVKDKICDWVHEESQRLLGISMTYSLIEGIKEKLDELLEDQPDHQLAESVARVELNETEDPGKSVKVKKDQLTKAQKRRMWDKGGLDTEERPRGWNWIDVVRHLSQTGPKETS